MKTTKSEQIRAGFHKSFQSGTSATVLTVCYGYKVTHGGELVIDPIEAKHCIFYLLSLHKRRQPWENF